MSENDPYSQSPYGQNHYGQNPYGGPAVNPYGVPGTGWAPVPHPHTGAVLVLGILGLVLCGLLAPVAWVMGSRAEREVASAPGRYSSTGTLKAGKILGIVGTVLIGLGLLLVVGVFVFGAVLGLADTSSSLAVVEYDF